MWIDQNNEFADAVTVAVAAGTTLFGSQINTGKAGNLDCDDLYLVLTVDTGIDTGGSAGTIQFALASDSTAVISTTASTVHMYTPAYATGTTTAVIPAGTVLGVFELPKGSGVRNDYKQYLGLLLIVGTTTITAGKVNAFLTPDGGRWKALADAQN